VKHSNDILVVCGVVTVAHDGMLAALDTLERQITEAGLNGIVIPLETIEQGIFEVSTSKEPGRLAYGGDRLRLLVASLMHLLAL
jgi:hypothetical protein